VSLRLLILGANGFIGSHLTERVLAERDWEVVGLDIRSHWLEPWRTHPRFEFMRGDIVRDFESVDALIRQSDLVLPLVAIATPEAYVRDPLAVFELTFEANLKVVRSCVEHGKRVVFASSSEVYGMCPDEFFDEGSSNLVMGPIDKHRWIYACSKQLLDRVIHACGRDRNLRYTIFRPFNWIGWRLDDPFDPREGSSRVLTQFIGNILRGEDIVLVDGGSQRRCFLYIDDAIEALMRILENRDGCADQQIFNLGNPEADVSIRDLAHLLLQQARQYPVLAPLAEQVRCVSIDAERYYGTGYQDIRARRPSIERARARLGWKPSTDLTTALIKTADFYFRIPSAQGASREAVARRSPSAGL
jgi:nucleoside-diphosphate-sugar epimerase